MDETQNLDVIGGVEQGVAASPPSDALIIIPVRDLVLFPGMIIPVTVGRERSIAAAQHALRNQRQVGILMQRESGVADPVAIDLYRIGTIANIVRYVTAPDGSHHLVCQGEERFEIAEFLKGWPFLVARVQRIPDTSVSPVDVRNRSSLPPPSYSSFGSIGASTAGAATAGGGRSIGEFTWRIDRSCRVLHGREFRGQAEHSGNNRRCDTNGECFPNFCPSN